MPRQRRRSPPSPHLDPLALEVLLRVAQSGRSDRAICADAGVDECCISKWRRGIHRPTVATMRAVVGALGGRIKVEWDE